jgi:tripartite-type tricarboxylate transporter receptor subunit TctC
MVNSFRILGLAFALMVAGATQAQSNGVPAAYPAHPIHWILPGAPGSPPDVAARILGEGLARELGQPVIVENRPGASGTIALAAVAKSAPDGYMLGFFSVPLMVAPSLFPVPYDTLHDFVPVTQFVQTRFLLAVRADSPLHSVGELISFAKANPGRFTFASVGNGSVPHLAGELLRLRAGIDIRHIPYKSGPFAFTALLGGQVDMVFSPPSTLAAHIKSGKLRALVTLAPSRLPEYPDVPTMAQAGLPGIEMGDWFSIAAPARTPRSIVDRLSAAVRKVLANGEASERLAAAGFAPVLDSGPDQLAIFVQSELKRWATVVREAGIHAD